MTKIKTIFLDMDGVICDFRGACNERKCIEGTKVDWKVVKSEGAGFWESIKWTNGGQQFYNELKKICDQENIDLYILSAVNYPDGKIGKINWLLKNTTFDRHHIIIVNTGLEKRFYANPTTLLIDDFKKNCDAFSTPKSDDSQGGSVILYNSPGQAISELTKILSI